MGVGKQEDDWRAVLVLGLFLAVVGVIGRGGLAHTALVFGLLCIVTGVALRILKPPTKG